MKKKNVIAEAIAKVSYETAVKHANSTCKYMFYQPILPEKVKKLRKF